MKKKVALNIIISSCHECPAIRRVDPRYRDRYLKLPKCKMVKPYREIEFPNEIPDWCPCPEVAD